MNKAQIAAVKAKAEQIKLARELKQIVPDGPPIVTEGETTRTTKQKYKEVVMPKGEIVQKDPRPVLPEPHKQKKPFKPWTPKAHDHVHQQKGRLPDQSQFTVVYDANAMQWTGMMTVPGQMSFNGFATGVFALLHALDEQYREWLANVKVAEAYCAQIHEAGPLLEAAEQEAKK